MTNAIHHVNSPSQNHQSTNTNTNNPLLIGRAKLAQLLNSSSPNDTILLSPLLIHNKHYPNTPSTPHTPNTTTTTTTTTSSSSTTSSGDNSPRLSSYDDNNNNHNNNNNNQEMMSPYNLQTTPTLLSPWTSTHSHNKHLPFLNPTYKIKQDVSSNHCCYLIGSLVREEGHVHSLAVKSGVLYTGSESNNIRVWNRFNDIGCLKSGSGFVKAIIVISYKVFTAHHDGKIRVWSHGGNNKRVGTFPKVTDLIKDSIKQVKLVSNMKHNDAVSCLGVNKELGLLYSASWDKTIKVWRIKDGKCMESIDDAHADAINAIVVGFGGGRHHHLLFSGGADGKLKMWEKKEHSNNNNKKKRCDRRTKHVHVRTLMEQEDAVTSLVVSHDDVRGGSGGVLYSGSSDGLVNFWEKGNKEERVVYGGALRGHKSAVLCLGAAGCMVFSGSADKSICVWRRHIDGVHSCLAVLYGHTGPVKCLAIERDHDDHDDHDDRDGDDDRDDRDDDDRCRKWIVYSGSLDKSVRIWRVSEETI